MPPKRTRATSKANPPKKRPKTSRVINDFNREYQAEDADITLISADGLEFRIHSHMLKAASVVFRDMISIGNQKDQEVVLNDTSIEDSGTLFLFLHICHGRCLTPGARNKHEQYIRLIKFAQKYDSDLVIQHLSLLFYQWCREGLLSPPGIFIIAYTVENVNLAAIALRECGGWHRTGRNSDVTDEEEKKSEDRARTTLSVVGSSSLDPSGMSYSVWQDIPHDYQFALIRATTHQIVLSDPKKSNWKKISEDFLEIMKEMGKMKDTPRSS